MTNGLNVIEFLIFTPSYIMLGIGIYLLNIANRKNRSSSLTNLIYADVTMFLFIIFVSFGYLFSNIISYGLGLFSLCFYQFFLIKSLDSLTRLTVDPKKIFLIGAFSIGMLIFELYPNSITIEYLDENVIQFKLIPILENWTIFFSLLSSVSHNIIIIKVYLISKDREKKIARLLVIGTLIINIFIYGTIMGLSDSIYKNPISQSVAGINIFIAAYFFYKFPSLPKSMNKMADNATFNQFIKIEKEAMSNNEILEQIREKLDTRTKELISAQKMESIGTLTGGIAHDFNNIIQMILGQTELLGLEEGLPESTLDIIESIKSSSLRAKNLTQKLLTFAKMVPGEMVSLNLNESIQKSMEMIRVIIPKMIKTTLEFNDQLGNINADETQIHQIIMNLCVNSRDAIKNEGEIRIKTDNITIDKSYIRNREFIPKGLQSGHYIRLSVTDTGCGIDDSTKSRIFEPFFTNKEQGTGLGLSVVYGIVQLHKGYINCESEIGVGTTFTILFPITGSIQKKEAPSIPTMVDFKGEGTILIVEDEETIQTHLKTILEKVGFKILLANSAEKGMEIIKNKSIKPDLILLDYIMEGKGGLWLLGEYKKYKKEKIGFQHCPIFLISGHIADSNPKQLKREGISEILYKPFTREDLLRLIAQHLH